MPIDPITWIIICTIVVVEVGIAAVARFWDEIKAWATKVVGYILDAVNSAIEVTSSAIIELVKRGNDYYQRAEVYVYNIYDEVFRKLSKEKKLDRVTFLSNFVLSLSKKEDQANDPVNLRGKYGR